IQSSKFGSRYLILFAARSRNASRNLSPSYPARACDLHARYFPSGEYAGFISPPRAVLTFTGFGRSDAVMALLMFSVKMSELVLTASSGTSFIVNAISFESGENAHPQPRGSVG